MKTPSTPPASAAAPRPAASGNVVANGTGSLSVISDAARRISEKYPAPASAYGASFSGSFARPKR